MPDNFCAEIRIGGKVPRSLVAGLVEALHHDEASHEYGDDVIPKDCTTPTLYSYLLTSVLDKTFLRFRNDRAENGEFEQTEEFCVKHDICFDRWSDHYCEYDAENVYFRSGMHAPLVTYADSDAKEIVCGATVREAIEKLDSFKENVGLPTLSTDHWENLDEGLRLLHDACPPLPDALAPFDIDEDK